MTKAIETEMLQPGVDLSKFKIQKIVEAESLETVTSQGWQLLAILPEDKFQMVYDTVPAPVPPAGSNVYYTSGQTMAISRNERAATHRYLVGLDEMAAHALLSNELVNAQQKYQKEAVRAAEAWKETAEAKKAADSARHDLADANQQSKSNADAYTRERDKARKLETDIAKLRSAIGELRMKEILGV